MLLDVTDTSPAPRSQPVASYAGEADPADRENLAGRPVAETSPSLKSRDAEVEPTLYNFVEGGPAEVLKADRTGGILWVAATPIGNLGDLTERVKAALAAADVVACEDTRHTGHLLQRLGIRVPLISYHEHNEKERAAELADRVAAGQNVVLVSDAGTPAISDPGFRLVRECRRRGLTVSPLPGPCALAAVLSASGLPTDQFFFTGFLKPKSAARLRFLEAHRESPFTVALYESTHRIEKLAAEMLSTLGPDRVAVFAREVTKQFESFHVGPLGAVVPQLLAHSTKGEFTVLIAPADFHL